MASLLLATLAGSWLSACGRSGSVSHAVLCSHAADVTTLTITRSVPPGSEVNFDFPARIVSNDRPAIGALARVTCALRPNPSGTYHCPADLGTTYGLDFTAESRQLAFLVADPMGCPSLTGLGTDLEPTYRFWDDLAVVMNLPAVRVNCDLFFGNGPLTNNFPTDCGSLLGDPASTRS